jgi:hypothetical protein
MADSSFFSNFINGKPDSFLLLLTIKSFLNLKDTLKIILFLIIKGGIANS